jgi:hypothetical protein
VNQQRKPRTRGGFYDELVDLFVAKRPWSGLQIELRAVVWLCLLLISATTPVRFSQSLAIVLFMLNASLSKRPWAHRTGLLAGRSHGVGPLQAQGDGTRFVPSWKYGAAFYLACVAIVFSAFLALGEGLGLASLFAGMFPPFFAYPVYVQRRDFLRWLAFRNLVPAD